MKPANYLTIHPFLGHRLSADWKRSWCHFNQVDCLFWRKEGISSRTVAVQIEQLEFISGLQWAPLKVAEDIKCFNVPSHPLMISMSWWSWIYLYVSKRCNLETTSDVARSPQEMERAAQRLTASIGYMGASIWFSVSIRKWYPGLSSCLSVDT